MSQRQYQSGDVVDLDDVAISLPAYLAWQATAQAGAAALAAMRQITGAAQIPDERGLLHEDGALEIFVEIAGVSRISMKIPPDQWAWV